MLNSLPPAVKRLALEITILAATLGGLALLVWASGLDAALARALYTPGATWAGFFREYAALLAGTVAWASLLLLFWPRIHQTRPLLAQSAVVIVITAVFGAGLLNQVVVKDLADRPRPRETVLLDQPPTLSAEFNGKSMPSGHAGMALVLAAPFFVLRRQRPKLAAAVLLGGTALAALTGVARMVAGAHFLSDVLVAALITLATARVAAGIAWRWQPIPRNLLLTLVVLVAAAFVLGNKFTVTVAYEAQHPWRRIQLPCTLLARPTHGLAYPTVKLEVSGYGAPTSQIKLVNDHGTVRLRTEFGLYHHLSCRGRLYLPAAE